MLVCAWNHKLLTVIFEDFGGLVRGKFKIILDYDFNNVFISATGNSVACLFHACVLLLKENPTSRKSYINVVLKL